MLRMVPLPVPGRNCLGERRSGLEQAVAAQALVEDGFDQLGLGEAGAPGGAAEDLFGPEIGLEVDLEEVAGAGVAIETELEAAIIERAIFLGDPARVVGDDRGPFGVV